jgi:hypothetical protein
MDQWYFTLGKTLALKCKSEFSSKTLSGQTIDMVGQSRMPGLSWRLVPCPQMVADIAKKITVARVGFNISKRTTFELTGRREFFKPGRTSDDAKSATAAPVQRFVRPFLRLLRRPAQINFLGQRDIADLVNVTPVHL